MVPTIIMDAVRAAYSEGLDLWTIVVTMRDKVDIGRYINIIFRCLNGPNRVIMNTDL